MTSISGFFQKIFIGKKEQIKEPIAETVLATENVSNAVSVFLKTVAPKDTIKALFFMGKTCTIKTIPFKEIDTEKFFKALQLSEQKLKKHPSIPQEILLDLHKTQITEIRRGLKMEDDLSRRIKNLTLTPYTQLDFIDTCIESIQHSTTNCVVPYLYSQALKWIDINDATITPHAFEPLFIAKDPMRIVLEYCGQEALANIALAFPKELSLEIIQKFHIRHEFSRNQYINTLRGSIQKHKLLEIARINLIGTTCITIGKQSETMMIEDHLIPCLNYAESPVELNLVGSPISDESLRKLRISVPKIDLSETPINGSILHSQSFNNTSLVNLSSCKNLDEQQLLSPRCPRPRSLDLSCTDITGESFSSSFYEQIRNLDLFNCLKVEDKFLTTLSSEHLELLNLSAATAITGSCFSTKVFQRLKELNLMHCFNVTDGNLKKLSSTALDILKLDHTTITGACFDSCQAFEKLKELSLAGCKAIKEKHLEKYQCIQLKKFDLSSTKIQGVCLFQKQFQTLEELSLDYCKNITDEFLLNLKLPNLKILSLKGTNITKTCLSSPLFKTVEKLTLSFCPNLRQDDTIYLKAPNLKTLIFEWFPYNDVSSSEDFSPLTDFPNDTFFKTVQKVH